MFSHLCRARLWPRPRKKSIGSSASSSPLPDDSENDEKEEKQTTPNLVLHSGLKKAQKDVHVIDAKDNKVEPNHLEFYLNWLLKISETQKELPIDHNCACKTCKKQPAKVPIATIVDAVKNAHATDKVLVKNNHHVRPNTPSRVLRGTPVSIRSHGKRHPKSKRPESALSISSVKSRSSNIRDGVTQDVKASLGGAENRVRKRHHIPRRRSSRSQRQQQRKVAIEEVVNRFGKHFNKALQMKRINHSETEPPSNLQPCVDMTTGPHLVAGYLYATLKNEQLLEAQKLSVVAEKVNSNPLDCRVKTDYPVVKPRVVNPKDNRLDAEELLKKSNKLNPTKVSMVVMQCCRFLPNLDKNIPTGQAERSLPMGTLVTALYREKEWLYVRTAHGNVGFIHKACCETIGTLPKRKSSLETQLVKPASAKVQEEVVSPNDAVLINAKTAKVKSLLTSAEHRSAFREVRPSNVADRTRLKTLAASIQIQKDDRPNLTFFNPESTSTLHKKIEKKTNEASSTRELVVIKDYNGGYKGVITTTIAVKKGDIVTVLKKDFDNWVYVKVDSGKVGYIPTTCTAKVGFL